MSRYKAYPEYRDSGIEWVGNIPNSWKVTPLFSVASAAAEKNDDGAESNVLSLSYGRIIRRDVEDNHGLLPESFNTYQIVDSGDIILRLTDLQNDKRSLRVGIANEKGIITSAYLKLAANAKFLDRYLYRLLHSYDTTKVFYGMGGGLRQSMRFEDMRRLQMLCPSLQEQEQIADFLDHETAKIDALIEKQQRLIELLKEKRQAVISHAVTKGLNPNAPMKDSGIEWLGEVPAHWEVTYLKHISCIRYGIGEPPSYKDDGVPLVRATNIRSGRIADENLVFVDSKDIPKNRIVWLKAGDIIVVRSGAGTGDSSLIPKKYDGSIAGFDMVVSPTEGVPEFLGYALLSNYIRNNQIDLEKTRAAQPHLNAEELGSCFVLLPPTSEQIEIANRIDYEISKFDVLIARADLAISLMQERRTALISAAVTGKIDVRDWQPAAA